MKEEIRRVRVQERDVMMEGEVQVIRLLENVRGQRMQAAPRWQEKPRAFKTLLIP